MARITVMSDPNATKKRYKASIYNIGNLKNIHMKTLILFLGFFLFVSLISCEPDNNPVNTTADCDNLISALLSFNNDKIENEFIKITNNLYPESTDDDKLGHKKNFETLLNMLNQCDSINASMICYACIETYPLQTELLIAIDSLGYKVNRIADIRTPDDNILTFLRVHGYVNDRIKLQTTDYFGCFRDNPYKTSVESYQSISDTLSYTIEDDTLTLNAILNYNCGSLLTDSVVIKNKEVKIFIADTCWGDSCQEDCICDFRFRYSFTDFLQNIHFYVYLKGFQDNEYTLWKETKFTPLTE